MYHGRRLFQPVPAGIFIGLVLFGLSCGSSNNNPTPAPATTPQPGAAATAVSIVAGAATLGNRAFSPDTVTISQGTTVTWTNNDSVTHTVTSDTGVWDSGNIAPGQTFSFQFLTPGSFSYHCSIHPGMVGQVQVSGGLPTPVISPTRTITPLPSIIPSGLPTVTPMPSASMPSTGY